MGLVAYALKFRITFYVIAVLVMLAGIGAAVVMPKDVLPEVDIPVITLVWTFTGLDTPEMESRVTTYTEVSISNNVSDIKSMQSTTLQGITIQRIYFQPSVSIDLAISQIVAATNSVRAVLPPGIQPPVIMRFTASSVPVIQLVMSSLKETQQQLYDYTQYRIRQTLATNPGATMPPPYGGTPRQIMVDLDLHALQARGLTPQDVTNAITAQNVTVPSGLAKIGTTQFVIHMNSVPSVISALNQIPIKQIDGAPVLMQDVAYVRDGGPPQQNIVRQDGRPSVLLTVLKNGDASTLSVVNNVKKMLPSIQAAAPRDMKITPVFDQSVFVSGAIGDVIRETVIAATLTALMILLFLGSWRSTLIVLISIPLAILTSLAILGAMGESINIMTLGGFALAVGILVDDVTVAIENSYRLMDQGKPFREAVAKGAAGIAKPALISTLSICGAFVSLLFLTGAPKYIFTPQALAVVFAMLASYFFSRTLVPILIDVLVKREYEKREAARQDDHTSSGKKGSFGRFHEGFERRFQAFRTAYIGLLYAILRHRWRTAIVAGLTLLVGGSLVPFIGTDYFPQVDSDQMTLHVRAPPGTRIEVAEQLFQGVEDSIRQVIPAKELGTIIDNIGLPSINYNLAFNDGSFVAFYDGQVLVTLKDGHKSSIAYMKLLRPILRDRFPNTVFYFQPADMITQILDFGSLAPIDIQVTGRHLDKDMAVAGKIQRALTHVEGAADVHLQQINYGPEYFVDVDRQRASELGLTEQQVANNLDVSLSGSFQITPNFWNDPKTGVPYQVWVQTPEFRNDSLAALENTPLLLSSVGNGGTVQLLSNVATMTRRAEPTVATHINMAPTFDIMANVQQRDLGSVERAIDRIVATAQKSLAPPDKIAIRGQVESKDQSFQNIAIGLMIAVVAVYLLMAVNYQSWGDPIVVLCALPIAFCGIAASLFITGTTFSIPSLMGAIMSVGVASANSILLVTFAREHRERNGSSAMEAAIAAGTERLRPVLMTAGAMFVGLIPMAIGIGEGSEQNAALARAVMGGIAVGTCGTLLFVPYLYVLLRQRAPKTPENYL
jgi:multidrug efflux pump subunit AcrB